MKIITIACLAVAAFTLLSACSGVDNNGDSNSSRSSRLQSIDDPNLGPEMSKMGTPGSH
ncbi:MAG: hypothetical protein WCD79_19400 [Chthoniobacteraceae bacterium]